MTFGERKACNIHLHSKCAPNHFPTKPLAECEGPNALWRARGFLPLRSALVCGMLQPAWWKCSVSRSSLGTPDTPNARRIILTRTKPVLWTSAKRRLETFLTRKFSRVRSMLLDFIQMMLSERLRALSLVWTLTSFNILHELIFAYSYVFPNSFTLFGIRNTKQQESEHTAEQARVKGLARVVFWQTWNLNSMSTLTSELPLIQPERKASPKPTLWICRSVH